MRIGAINRLTATLLLALIASGCDYTQPVDRTPAAQNPRTPTGEPATSTAAPTSSPQQDVPTSTAEQPAPTTTPLATVAQTPPTPVRPPAASTTPAGAQARLPADTIWLVADNQVLVLSPDAATIDLPGDFQTTGVSEIAAAPDGSAFAYSNGSELGVFDAASGESRLLDNERAEAVVAPQFSPDGKHIAFTAVGPQSWALYDVDLESGEQKVLQQEAGAQPVDPLLPIGWTPAGIYVIQVLWGTDAGPQNLALLDPAQGELQSFDQRHFRDALPSPDGSRVAMWSGYAEPGEPRATSLLSVFNPAEQTTQVVFPEAPLWIDGVAWSAAGDQLVFSSAPTTMDSADTIHTVSADGSGELQATLSDLGIAGAIRDVGWRNDRVVVLVAADDDMLRVYEMDRDLRRDSIQELGARQGPTARDRVILLLHIPQ